ncbi:thiol-disulfide oxidoreductase [Capnocytophaga stomatis]|uniref:Thiol-disulfide oxidoreductase n=1 Tax=Capnocytophaga stomatis TaxID=1848904 RepID=A0A250G1V7_9FLAO|nr:DCC1-like thiol-disulfide oxidoreductase family protein [Capnocytophaga stomatis]ATA90226.1 thiol-disulfide oxidoreductase [Capnocytophaga stomatis]
MNNPILIFDGDCIFCNRVAYFLAKTDKKDFFRFVSSTSEKGKQIIKENNLQEMIDKTVIVRVGERFFFKSQAMYYFLKISKTFPFFRFLIWIFPTFLADFFYDIIARNRKKIIKSECPIPEPEIRKKFL